MGQPVCRGLRPVSMEEGSLVVEDGVIMRGCIIQHATLTLTSSRQVVRWARSDQSACHAKPMVVFLSFLYNNSIHKRLSISILFVQISLSISILFVQNQQFFFQPP